MSTKATATMKVTVNGVVMEGNPSDIINIAKTLGVDLNVSGEYYYSESKKQFLTIADMPGPHVKNALQKRLKENFAKYMDTAHLLEGEAYVKHLMTLADAVVSNDKVVVSLLYKANGGTAK